MLGDTVRPTNQARVKEGLLLVEMGLVHANAEGVVEQELSIQLVFQSPDLHAGFRA